MAGSSRCRFGVLLAAIIATLSACQPGASRTTLASEPSATGFRWPSRAPVIATIEAPKPPADDVHVYKPILLAAYRKACSDVVKVESAIRDFRPRSELLLIHCGEAPVRAVRLVFTGVVVPNLRSVLQQPGMEEPRRLLGMLGLRWRITRRSAPGREAGNLVTQEPSPGQVVPFGTVVHVLIAR